MSRAPHPVPAHIVTLPAIHTSSTLYVSCHQQVRLPIHLLNREQREKQGSAPMCPPRAEGLSLTDYTAPGKTIQLRPCELLSTPASRRLRTCQGPSTKSKHLRASHLSRESRGRNHGELAGQAEFPQPVILQALGPTPSGNAR